MQAQTGIVEAANTVLKNQIVAILDAKTNLKDTIKVLKDNIFNELYK